MSEFSIGNNWQKPTGQVAGAYMANNTNEDVHLKKNPLDNKNLPGGIFTHPDVLNC